MVEPGLARSERIAGARPTGRPEAGGWRIWWAADPELVESDSRALAESLGRVLERLDDGQTALVVGHSPTNEAAILGSRGEIVDRFEGEPARASAGADGFRIERLD